MMNRKHVVGASILALAAALGSGEVRAGAAGRLLTVAVPADYNAAQVAGAGGVVTVPAGLGVYSLNGVGSLEVNSRFTVTLPTGFTFSSAPSLTTGGAGQITSTALLSGGIDSQTATFTIGAPAVAGGNTPLGSTGSLILNQFAVQGTTALETPIPVAAALPIRVQATNNSQINDDDAKPLSAPAFASEPGADLLWVPGIALIDLTAPSLGTSYIGWQYDAASYIDTPPYIGPPDTTTIGLLGMRIFPEAEDAATRTVPVLSPNGQANALATSDTATVTVAGLFNGIQSAFLSSTYDCQTPVLTGTVTPTQVSFSGAPLTSLSVLPESLSLCLTADGKSLLQANPQGFAPQLAPGTSTDFLATGGDNLAPPLVPNQPPFAGLIAYEGGGVISVTNFFTGDDSGYSSLLQVNNAGGDPATLYALVQPDTGGAPLSGLLGTLAGGTGTVFTEAQVQAVVPGLNLANSGQRSTLQLIVAGTADLSIFNQVDFSLPFFGNAAEIRAQGLLVNPSGVVTQMPGTGKLEQPLLP
jgi:hypothetical protein